MGMPIETWTDDLDHPDPDGQMEFEQTVQQWGLLEEQEEIYKEEYDAWLEKLNKQRWEYDFFEYLEQKSKEEKSGWHKPSETF